MSKYQSQSISASSWYVAVLKVWKSTTSSVIAFINFGTNKLITVIVEVPKPIQFDVFIRFWVLLHTANLRTRTEVIPNDQTSLGDLVLHNYGKINICKNIDKQWLKGSPLINCWYNLIFSPNFHHATLSYAKLNNAKHGLCKLSLQHSSV